MIIFQKAISLVKTIVRKIFLIKKYLKRFIKPVDIYLLNGYPLERDFGIRRGIPIDRYYIEKFLSENNCISGNVLEIGDNRYSKKFGKNIISHVLRGKNGMDYINLDGSLLEYETLSNYGLFNTLIITNVLSFIFDHNKALENLSKIIDKGGKCLITVNGLSGMSNYDNDRWGDYWRYSEKSLSKLLRKYFKQFEIKSYGNASTAAGIILGLTKEDYSEQILDILDKSYPVVICAKAWDPI